MAEDTSNEWNHANERYIAIDVECVATGVSYSDRAVAIVAVVDEEEQTVFHKYVKPEVPVCSYLTPLTGITEADLEGASSLADVVTELKETLSAEETVIVGHNVCTDIEWLGLQEGVHFKRFEDTSALFQCADIYEPWKVHSFSLRHICIQLLGYDPQDGIHSPVIDACCSMRLLKMYGMKNFTEDQLMQLRFGLLHAPKPPPFWSHTPYIDGCEVSRNSQDTLAVPPYMFDPYALGAAADDCGYSVMPAADAFDSDICGNIAALEAAACDASSESSLAMISPPGLGPPGVFHDKLAEGTDKSSRPPGVLLPSATEALGTGKQPLPDCVDEDEECVDENASSVADEPSTETAPVVSSKDEVPWKIRRSGRARQREKKRLQNALDTALKAEAEKHKHTPMFLTSTLDDGAEVKPLYLPDDKSSAQSSAPDGASPCSVPSETVPTSPMFLPSRAADDKVQHLGSSVFDGSSLPSPLKLPMADISSPPLFLPPAEKKDECDQ